MTEPLLHPPVLLYHSLEELGVGDGSGAKLFERQMAYLAHNGYRTLTPAQFVVAINDSVWDPKSLLLTFDDGFMDFYTDAFPVLRQSGLTATVFLISDVVEQGLDAWKGPQYPVTPPVMGWREVRELAEQGIGFGSHGVTHSKLGALKGAQLADEAVRSKVAIERELGAGIQLFSYPYGDCSEATRSAVEAAGYAAALGVSPRESQRFEVFRRIIRPARTSIPFRLRVSGAYPALRRSLHAVRGDAL